jgi:hypothetical protein
METGGLGASAMKKCYSLFVIKNIGVTFIADYLVDCILSSVWSLLSKLKKLPP